MKFLQFYRDGRPTLGVITEKGVVDMSAHPELPQTMLALCQSGDTAALAALDGPYLDEESLTLAPVVTGMEKILCIGLNYRAHAAECGIPLPERAPLSPSHVHPPSSVRKGRIPAGKCPAPLCPKKDGAYCRTVMSLNFRREPSTV